MPLSKRAQHTTISLLGKNHIDVAESLLNLAKILWTSKVTTLFEEALKVYHNHRTLQKLTVCFFWHAAIPSHGIYRSGDNDPQSPLNPKKRLTVKNIQK